MNEKHCTLLFVRKDDQILLAMKKRSFGEGKWNGVGGKLDPRETFEQSMLRETREEIDVIPMHYWKVAEHDFHEFHKGEASRMLVHVYFCDEWQREPVESEEMRPQWFSVKDIPYADMWPDDEYWLPQVLSGNKVIAEFHIDENDVITQHDVKVVEKFSDEPATA